MYETEARCYMKADLRTRMCYVTQARGVIFRLSAQLHIKSLVLMDIM